MRLSRTFAPTLRDAPGDAEAASHRLLLRAGFIRPVLSGVYAFLPLGRRTLAKIEAIVREEMNAAGAQEVALPALLPVEDWRATGRLDAYGDLMFRLRDRTGRELCLGPTHEEALTPLVGGEHLSYRDLPFTLYQIQWKYRDEVRPRSGIVRGREFLMKDAYSFDRSVDDLRVSYEHMIAAYRRIFDRCGLDYRMVEADPGLIGGDVNHEFMVPAAIGEDCFVACSSCDYAANLEAATAGPAPERVAEREAMSEIHTPNRPGIRSVVELLGIEPDDMLKCMVYEIDAEPTIVLVPGGREVNEGKLGRAFPGSSVRRLEDSDIDRHGLVKGYVGPQDHGEIAIVADHRVRAGANWVTGANRKDHHVTGANLDRDFHVDRWVDVATVRPGDPCSRCGGSLELKHAIEVGHCFQLGSRYSEPLQATFVDEVGLDRHFVMGCYGIGISRVVAAIAEQHHDDAGLAWPCAAAPFHVALIPVNMDRTDVTGAAENLYDELSRRGFEVVLDDRPASPGVKFADADLIGWPIQVLVGRRGVERGTVEVKVRSTGHRVDVAYGDAPEAIARCVD